MHIIIRDLGLCSWLEVSENMNHFTKHRKDGTFDELWLVEHYPVYTHGLSEKKIKLKYIQEIPVFFSNRGGKITYHGPGQLVIYILLNLKRNHIKFRNFIHIIEKIIIQVLLFFSITAHIKKDQPGVYINNQKICSLGFRIIKGCSLHGASLNINMDLTPFKYINPCGRKDIIMTQVCHHNKHVTINIVKEVLIKIFCKNFKIKKYCKKKMEHD
ncbi:lipoyl(octanoyl) transferase LipB [Buchnera aphidicola]|uniref:lipoyl(octanoyl) transferase LipB n=1 Tax=Buchnera aphidicola TaxID=9 RepID=UPI00094C2688|nr:lipoyl(octanoyl) transferase LipB [Buchnera aphidicola]